jgi:hypothetical protein
VNTDPGAGSRDERLAAPDLRPTARTREELIRDVLPHQADPALRAELRELDELTDLPE